MAHLRKLLPILVCSALPFAINTAAAEQFINTEPLLKEVVAASPGLELIIPSIIETDTNADEYPEKITTKFKVFRAGSNSKLFTTPQRKFTPPAIPCNNIVWMDWDWELDFIGEDNTHTAMAMAFYVECQQPNGVYKEAAKAYIYVADTTQAGSGWAKSWPKDLLSVDFVDWDNDQQEEVKVVLITESSGGEKIRVIFLDKMTGNVESDKSYSALQLVD